MWRLLNKARCDVPPSLFHLSFPLFSMFHLKLLCGQTTKRGMFIRKCLYWSRCCELVKPWQHLIHATNTLHQIMMQAIFLLSPNNGHTSIQPTVLRHTPHLVHAGATQVESIRFCGDAQNSLNSLTPPPWTLTAHSVAVVIAEYISLASF